MLNTMVVSQLVDGKSAVGILVAVFLGFFIKRRFFPSKKNSKSGRKWKSPLLTDTRKPITPMETDQKQRDKIIKKVFDQEVATGQQYDAIVIGSGIGGMTSAALLAKAGMKVLVLEQHGKLGGACHIFKAEGYEFDVGIHYIGGFNRRTLNRTLLEQISDGQIQWANMDDNFDVMVMDFGEKSERKFGIPSGRGAWKKQLIEKFPQEKKGIEKYFDMIDQISRHSKYFVMLKVMPLWIVRWINRFGLATFWSKFFSLGGRTLKEVVEEVTDNQDLRMLLCYIWGDYGTPPSRSSFALHALLISHFEFGASYPIGGASEIPFRIAPVIERNGGAVMMKAPVDNILIDQAGRVSGVRVRLGKAGSGQFVDIHAPIVISDAGIHNTFKKLLPEHVARTSPTWPLVNLSKPGIGCISVFIGLKGTTQELGLRAQNMWVFSGNDPEKGFDSFMNMKLEDVLYKPYPFFFIGFPSAKDPSWDSRYPGRSTITIVTFGPYSWFQDWSEKSVKKRGTEYDSLKNAIGQQLVDQAVALFPNIKDAVDHWLVGTPVTMEHYLAAQQGAIYGLDHNKERFLPEQAALLRPDSGIPGLYLAGQDIMSAGFTSGLMSGLMCASTILDSNLYTDLINLHQKIKFNSEKKDN